MSKTVTVLVMDDAAVVRGLLARMLGRVSGVGGVLQAADAQSALALMDSHRPEIAILDLKVPGHGAIKNGIDVLLRIKQVHPGTAVIMLTNHANPRYRTECLRAGAAEFFDKSIEFEKLLDAVAGLAQRVGSV
jgi:DNA-binding NarL/FixJ family response regulator